MVVDFPAPFGPRRPTICPVGIEKLTSSTALNSPKRFERCETSIIFEMSLKFLTERIERTEVHYIENKIYEDRLYFFHEKFNLI